MKNLRLFMIAFTAAFLLIAFGCEKEYVTPDHGTLPPMDAGEFLDDNEPEYPNSQCEASCDTLICCDGFELPEKTEN